MQISPLREDQATEALELWNQTAVHDTISAQLFHEKIWGDADFDQDWALVASDSSGPIAFTSGVVRKLEAGPRGYLKFLAVAPEHQRQGLGARLVGELEERLERQGAKEIRVAESAPNYLTPGVDARYEGALRFFQSLGYEPIGEAKNLVVNLADRDFCTLSAEQKLVDQGITICRATVKTKPLLDDFLKPFWPSWQAEVGTSLLCDLPAVHVALADRAVVGFSAYDGNNQGTGWFGPMGTHPDYRGMGIGKVLSARCLQDLRAQGLAQAIIPWVSETSLYESQLGAVPDRCFVRSEKRIS